MHTVTSTLSSNPVVVRCLGGVDDGQAGTAVPWCCRGFFEHNGETPTAVCVLRETSVVKLMAETLRQCLRGYMRVRTPINTWSITGF
jgi:hypothetical protein